MRCAFGECGCCGVKPPFAARAAPAVTRAPMLSSTTRSSLFLTRGAFYEGGRALADRPAVLRPRRLRGVRRRRSPDSWRRLRDRGPCDRVPAADSPGGAARLLAVGLDVAGDRRHLSEARNGRSRLRDRRQARGRDRPYAGTDRVAARSREARIQLLGTASSL